MSFLVVWALCPLVLIPMTIVFGVQKSNLNKKVKFMEKQRLSKMVKLSLHSRRKNRNF